MSNEHNESQDTEECDMHNGISMIMEKYPKYNDFIQGKNGVIFTNLLIAILVLKIRLGHYIDPTETFYTHMLNFDLTIFDNIEFENDLPQLFKTTIKLGILFISSCQIDEESKDKIYTKLINYSKP